MILCHSSGSSCSARSIEPFTSAKSTVTCLRSPSSALRDVRILSARCFGVYARGSNDTLVADGRSRALIRAPHLRHTLAPGSLPAAHAGQLTSIFAPHSEQNDESARFSARHFGHSILKVPSLHDAYFTGPEARDVLVRKALRATLSPPSGLLCRSPP